jgi:hypothetical protein
MRMLLLKTATKLFAAISAFLLVILAACSTLGGGTAPSSGASPSPTGQPTITLRIVSLFEGQIPGKGNPCTDGVPITRLRTVQVHGTNGQVEMTAVPYHSQHCNTLWYRVTVQKPVHAYACTNIYPVGNQSSAITKCIPSDKSFPLRSAGAVFDTPMLTIDNGYEVAFSGECKEICQ